MLNKATVGILNDSLKIEIFIFYKFIKWEYPVPNKRL